MVAAATSEDNSKGQLLTTTKRRTSSAYRTLTHPPLSSQATWWPWEGRSCGSTSRKRLETKLDVQQTWLGLRCTPACLRGPSCNVACAPHSVPHSVNQTAAPSVLSHADQVGRSSCLSRAASSHCQWHTHRCYAHTTAHTAPPTAAHAHALTSPSFSHPTSASQPRARCRAMMKITAAHTALASQLQARYHAREEWQQAAGHQWRRTHRKTGERRMYTTANTLLTGLQTMGIRTCWPRCTLANKPPLTATSARVSLTCSACLSRDCSFRCI